MQTLTYKGHEYTIVAEAGNITLQGLHQDIFLPGLHAQIEQDAKYKVNKPFLGNDDFPEMDYDSSDVEVEIEETIESRIKQHLRDHVEGSAMVQVISHNLN